MIADHVIQRALELVCGKNEEEFEITARKSLNSYMQHLMGHLGKKLEASSVDRNVDKGVRS